MAFIDTKGIFGPAGTSYTDGRYNTQEDYDVWTSPTVTGAHNGINPSTGKPYTRADAGFGSYTTRHDTEGQRVAAQQAADSGGGMFDLSNPLTLAMLAATIYSGGSAAGLWGAETAGAGALAAGDAMAGLIPASELGALEGVSTNALANTTWGGGNYNWPTVGGEGMTGVASGTLNGTAGALGSTSGAAGLTGTIEGLGTLTAEGMLIPAAGGAAIPLGALSDGLSLSQLKTAVDAAKTGKSMVDSLASSLGKGVTGRKATGALSGFAPFAVPSGVSLLQQAEDDYSKERGALDDLMRNMAQSGKGAYP